MYKYTKYKQHVDTPVQQNALNKIHTRSCVELVHKSLYDVHAACANRSVRSRGANSVQIVSSFNLHFSSADRVEFPKCKRCSVKIFFTMLKVLFGAAFELGIVSSAFASATRRINMGVPVVQTHSRSSSGISWKSVNSSNSWSRKLVPETSDQ